MTPKVSICVPNLNTRPFLPERFQTIRDQTLQDWELLVYDSYSNDGAWEYICETATREPRMHAWQGPREGTPGSWNPCIRAARGEYVYIATSDDTMPADCLEKLVAALDANPDCDLAHCPLRAIDENGNDVVEIGKWWSEASAFVQSSGPFLHRLHVRRAPFDGLLHLLGGSVYVSITQLLIRRRLFDRIGGFESRWGSVRRLQLEHAGRAGRQHSPCARYLGRVARSRESGDRWNRIRFVGTGGKDRRHDRACDPDEPGNPSFRAAPTSRLELVGRSEERRAFTREVAARYNSTFRRRNFILRRFLTASIPAREYVKSRLYGGCPSDWVRRCLDEAGHGPAFASANRSSEHHPQ